MPTIITGEAGIDKIQDSIVTSNKIANNAINYTNVPSGSVLQTIQTISTTQYAYTPGAAGMATSISVKITPKFASSKILITAQIFATSTSAGYVCDFFIKRNGITCQTGNSATNDNMLTGYYVNGGTDKPWITLPINLIDYPNSVLEQEYVLWAQSGNSGTTYLNRRSDNWSSGPTILIVTEIKA